jgi:membrane protein
MGGDGERERPRRRFALPRDVFSRLDRAGVTDLAGFLAYYSALSIFPTIAALVALLGLVGNQGTAKTLIDAVSSIAPQSAVNALSGPIHGLVSSNGEASVAAAIAFVAALWAASGYVGGFVRAANAIHGVEESRPIVRRRAILLGLTLGCVGLLALMLLAIGLSGPLLDSAARSLGLGSTAKTVFEIARWPLLAAAGTAAIAILARYGPDLDPRPWGAVVAGTALSLAIWILASLAFALYVATLGSYQATYASLAGAIVFLIWLWISNLALLAGIALNAELALRRPSKRPSDERGPAPEPLRQGVERTA